MYALNYIRFLWLCFLIAVAYPLAAKQPEIPVPRNAQVSIVGKNMTVGGKTMDIRQLYTRDKMEKVKDFYYRRWAEGEQRDMPGYLASDDMPPWHVISRLEQGYLLTVQIQRADDGGTWGYLASSKLVQETAPSSSAAAMPSLSGTDVLHDMQTRDAGQSGETMLLSNQHSLSSNVNYYKNYYLQRGWRADMDQAMPGANTHVLAFTNGREKINIVLMGTNNNTKITVNKVIHDIL